MPQIDHQRRAAKLEDETSAEAATLASQLGEIHFQKKMAMTGGL
eukprot:CAMPEP_0177177902 /NCGR_PEP_ID=MMETSP0367-20130122/14044_1 /TAXON_ID=447022 ORGANISM="Scrippsiella hangoei-like, Strain SHHI-4" /NCGR_SAMPLE_ID=MMETSP0367 /ASSEMBLY_ACC=CAM_ASM_000362 /LENGTH=43 /DNA_ID= /DNA_START= /DNA_END= /DNA_ORIENTATION=